MGVAFARQICIRTSPLNIARVDSNCLTTPCSLEQANIAGHYVRSSAHATAHSDTPLTHYYYVCTKFISQLFW